MSSGRVTTFRLSAACPVCGTPPRLQHVEHIDRILRADADPDEVFQSYQCHVERCGEIYEIYVRDFRRAG